MKTYIRGLEDSFDRVQSMFVSDDVSTFDYRHSSRVETRGTKLPFFGCASDDYSIDFSSSCHQSTEHRR